MKRDSTVSPFQPWRADPINYVNSSVWEIQRHGALQTVILIRSRLPGWQKLCDPRPTVERNLGQSRRVLCVPIINLPKLNWFASMGPQPRLASPGLASPRLASPRSATAAGRGAIWVSRSSGFIVPPDLCLTAPFEGRIEFNLNFGSSWDGIAFFIPWINYFNKDVFIFQTVEMLLRVVSELFRFCRDCLTLFSLRILKFHCGPAYKMRAVLRQMR